MTDAVYLARNGQQLGPYTVDQLAAMAASGEIQPGDMAWHSGMSDWAGVDSVLRGLGIAAAPPPVPPAAPAVPEAGAAASGRNLAAGLGARWLASILDCLLLIVVCTVAGGLLSVFQPMGRPGGGGLQPGFLLTAYLVQLAYFTLTQGGRHMASLGKRAMKMIVVGRDGRRLGYVTAFFRYLLLLVSGYLFPLLLVALFTRRRQGLHDLLLGTVVIERDSYDPQHWDYERIEKSPRGGGALLVAAIVFMLIVPTIGVLAAIAIPAYQDYTMRSRVMMALQLAEPVETRIEQRLAHGGAPLQYADVGLDGPESLPQGAGLLTMDPQGTLTITLGLPGLEGQTIVLTPAANGSPAGWRCSSGDVRPAYLPSRCRTSSAS